MSDGMERLGGLEVQLQRQSQLLLSTHPTNSGATPRRFGKGVGNA